MAGDESGSGKGILARVLRRIVSFAIPNRGARAARPRRSVCQPVAGIRAHRNIGGSDALPAGRAARPYAGALHPPPAMGEGRWIPSFRARDGAALRVPDLAGGAILEPH